jgi:hypothetical protein
LPARDYDYADDDSNKRFSNPYAQWGRIMPFICIIVIRMNNLKIPHENSK